MAVIDATRFGASTSVNDNAHLINFAIRNAAPGDTVWIPPGEFCVDAVLGIHLKSNITLRIDGALKAIPNNVPHSNVILADGTENVSLIINGKIVGERSGHLSTIGEWGMGVKLYQSSNVSITGCGSVSECWGDGLYVEECKNVRIDGIKSIYNRRQGMSVTAVDGLTIRNAAFCNTGGTAPQSGIDFEPDYPTQFIRNVSIERCIFANNAGAGILFGFGSAPKSNFQNIVIANNTFVGNKPVNGLDPWYAKLAYASCRWMDYYDWWGVPRDVHLR